MKTLRSHKKLLSSLMLSLVAVWQVGQPLQAATYLWNQTTAGTGYSWITTSNWTPAGFPNAIGDVANLNNDIGGDQTVSLNQVITLGTLNIGDATGSNIFTLAAGTGGYLVLDDTDGTVTIGKTTGGADVISTGLSFNDALTITNDSAGLLTLSGALRSMSSDITFGGTGAGGTRVTGGIFTGGSLIKNDSGTLTLRTTVSTYAGQTLINGGTLILDTTDNLLPQRSAVTIASGATLNVQRNTILGSVSGAGNLTNTSGSDRIIAIGRDDTSTTFTGRINPSTASRVAITKIGAGTWTLQPTGSNASTYTGNTIINGGAIVLDTSNSSLTGGFLGATPLQLAGGNFGMIGRSGATVSQTLGNFTLGATGGSIIMTPNGGTSTTLALGTFTATTAGGTLLVNAPTGTSVTTSTARPATGIYGAGRAVFTDGAGAYNWLSADTTSGNVFTGLGTGVGNTPAYTGALLADGTTASATGNYTLTGSQVQNTAASTIGTLKVTTSGTGQSLDLNGLNLTTGGLLFTGTDAYEVKATGGGVLSAGNASGTYDLLVHQYGTHADGVTISAVIGNNGANAVNLVKAGTGKLVLGTANTFTGGVFVSGGILSFSDNNQLGAHATAATALTIRDGATLQYTGATATIAGSGAVSHTYSLQGGNANIEVANAATTLTLSGAISGGGNLVKSGAGILAVGTATSYSGSTIINEGTLRITAADLLPSTPLSIASGAFLDISSGNDTVGAISGAGTITGGTTTSARTLTVGADNVSSTFSGTFQGTAAAHVLAKSGSGTLTLTGATSAWTGGTTINSGVLLLGATNTLSTTGAMNINRSANPAALELAPGFTQTLASFSIYGTNSATTSSAQIFIGSGATLTTAGTVTVNNNGNPLAASIDGAGNFAMTAARTFDVRDSTTVPTSEAELVINTTMSGANGGITKVGGGGLKITGTNIMTGTTTNTFNSGTAWLDYTTNNTDKINDTGALAFGGGTVILTGNNSAATTQTVAGLTLTSGSSVLTLNAGAGQTLALNLGAITRATSGGAMRFNLPTGAQSSSNGFVTSQTNVNGILGGYATATDGSGTGFATNSGGNIVLFASTAQDDVTLWTTGADITDSTGFTGTLGSSLSINTLRFNAAGPSTVTIAGGSTLQVASGGVLQTASVTGGTSLITGGTLSSGTGNELIFTVDGATQRLEVASALTGATIITKAGNGTLRLSGTNTNTGAVNLYGGTLQVDGGRAFGDTTAFSLSANNSTVFHVLASETVGTLSGGQNQAGLASEIRIASGTALTINQSANATYSGSITDSGTFIKTGTGTLAVDAAATTSLVSANSFTGAVIINQGILEFNGATGSLSGATSWTINGPGALYSNKNSGTSPSADAIGNSVGITLNNTNQGGIVFNTEGFVHRTNQGNTRAETIGSLTLGAGHNTITAYGNATNAIADLVVSTSAGISRAGRATSLVRGNALGASSGTRSQIRVSDATGNTALDAAEVGDATNTGTKIKIIPWLVGDLSQIGLGNTFVTNVNATNGLRPLAVGEYISDTTSITGTLTDNIRFTATANITSTPATINSLVLDSATAIALTGSASNMEITSGALLAAGAGAHSIDVITALTTGGGRDYTIYVTDPAGSLTLNSPLTSAVPLVKSGAGTLILGSASNAVTDLYFNQGVVRVDAVNKLGGAGALNFFGGTLRYTGTTTETTGKTASIGLGGAVFDIASATGSLTLSNAVGMTGAGGTLTKTGAGTLTLDGAANTYTGATTVNNGRLQLNGSVASAITVNGGTSTQGSFGGSGTVTGGVTLATNGATSFAQGPALNPGAVGAAGTLTINTAALTTNDFSTLTFDLTTATTAGSGVNDLISTDILPVFAGSTQININALASLTAGGTYTLISGYTGTLTSFANLSLNSVFTGETKSGVLLNNSGQLQLLVTGATPTTAYWAGDRDAFWNSIDTGTAATNWRTDVNSNANTFALPGASTDVHFYTTTPTAGNLATTLGASFTIKSLTFDASATSAVSISGGSLTLTPLSSSTGLTLDSGVGAVTINSDVALGAAQTWTNNSTNALTVNGEVSGVFNLTKAGAGSLVLNGTNTFVGTFTQSAGTVVAGNSQALGLAANALVLNAGTLDLASDASTTPHNTTIGGNMDIISNRATAGAGITHTLGSLTIGAQTLSISKGANVTSGTAGLTFGATDIGTGGVVFNAATDTLLTITGIISGGPGNSDQITPAANTAITITGGGSVTFGNTGNTFTGDILVDGGGFNVDNARDWGGTTVISSTSKTVTLINGGRLNVTSGTINPGNSATTSYYLVQIGSGGGTIDTATGAILQLDDAGQLFGSGTLTKSGGGTLALRNHGIFAGSIIVTGGLLQPSGGTGSNLGTITAGTTIQSGAALNLNGISIAEAEPLVISGTGLAANPAGVITNSSGTSATFLGPVTLADHATIGGGSGAVTLSGGITGAFDLTIKNAAGATTLSTVNVNNGGAITNNGLGGGTTTISALIGGNVTGITQDSSSSKLILSNGLNAFNFDVLIKSGTLQGSQNTAGQTTSLGLGSVQLGDTGGSASATLELQGSQATFANSVILGTTSGTLTIQSANTGTAVNFTGGITGANSVSFNNGANTAALNITTGAVNNSGSLTNITSGGGALNISANIGSSVTNIIQNSATSVMTLSGSSIEFTGGIAVNAGILNITGGGTTAPTPNALTVAGGGTLNLINGAGQAFALGGGVINLGAGAGTATFGLELGSTGAYDRFTSSAAAVTANNIVLNLTALTGFGAGTYDLFTAPSGLNAAAYSIGTVSGVSGVSLALATDPTYVRLTATAATGDHYWDGSLGTSWTTISGGNTNWSSDLAGNAVLSSTPGVVSSVIFSSDDLTGTTLTTTLDAAFSIKDLTFNNQVGGGPLGTINIQPGTGGTLTVTPTVATAGINVETGAPAAINLSAPVILGASQTWTNASAGLLTVSGGVTGAFDLALAAPSTGGITLSTGSVNNGGTITNSSSGSGGVTISGIIGTNVTGVIQNSSTSALTLGAVANTWTGGLTIKAGSVLGGNNANTFGGNANVITLGDTSGSADTLLRPFNSHTYLQPITVKGGNTGVATLMLGTTTGAVIWGGAITLDTHDLTIAKQGTTGATQVTGGITGTGNLTIDNDGTTGTITLATTAIDHVGSITNVGSATGTTTISANIGGNVTDVIQNSATSGLALSGTNAFTGGVDLMAGTLTLGSTTALGATGGTLTITGGTTLNSNVANLVNANNNAVVMNGDFTFTGTQSLDLGTGAVSLGSTAGARQITVTANTLTLGGAISDGTATALTKAEV